MHRGAFDAGAEVRGTLAFVMAGQKARSAVFAAEVPAIHVLLATKKDVDARHKAGHDEENVARMSVSEIRGQRAMAT